MASDNAIITLEQHALILPEGDTIAKVREDIALAIYREKKYHEIKPIHGGPFTRTLREFDVSGARPKNYEGPGEPTERIKAGPTLLGFYGVVGETMLCKANYAELMAIVHIPPRLLPYANVLVGKEEYGKFLKQFFSQRNGTDWEGAIWNIEANSASRK